MIRQKRKGQASKLQLAFQEWMEAKFVPYPDYYKVMGEVITLRLGNGVTYRPDAWTAERMGKLKSAVRLVAWEVKGPHFWAAAKVKLKVAATMYPWIQFNLVTRPQRNGEWKIERVEP